MNGLTVAVPTRDRQERLVGALEAIASELGPHDELLVVDNGSNDQTAAAAEAFIATHVPSGRVVAEPAGGISVARNSALRKAGHPVVCFVDDDVRVQPGWLAALRRAWTESAQEVACIGGPLLPEWQVPRPPWLADYLLYVVSVLDLGGERRRLDQAPRVGYVWGGNMSIRVESALALGGFEPGRGVRPDEPSDRGEEEELQRRFAQAGFETWYEPAAAALHLVPPERLTEEYFADAFRARGRAEARSGKGRARALAPLGRGLARYAALRVLRRPEAPAARFISAYGWSLMTSPRGKSRPHDGDATNDLAPTGRRS
jgi:glucosyl-dolichyl phosphate glucuronosyltransferase